MNFQYYDNLKEKGKKSIEKYLEQVRPALDPEELKFLLADLASRSTKAVAGKWEKSSFREGFLARKLEVDMDAGRSGINNSKLTAEEMMQVYKVLVSHELEDRRATKWRFYQFIKFSRELHVTKVHINATGKLDDPVDFILETIDGKLIHVICSYLLELDHFNKIMDALVASIQNAEHLPSQVILGCSKTYRNIPIDDSIRIKGEEISIDLWAEWVDLEKPFNGEDLLVLNTEDNLAVAGYNFSSIPSLLDYVYKFTDGGQISIYRQPGFFSEVQANKAQHVELVWKGIMIKTK